MVWRFTTRYTTAIADDDAALRNGYALEQGYPHPVPNRSVFTFTIQIRASVSLVLYSVHGARIGQILEGAFDAGVHVTTWDRGAVPPGLYLLRMTSGAVSMHRTVILQ